MKTHTPNINFKRPVKEDCAQLYLDQNELEFILDTVLCAKEKIIISQVEDCDRYCDLHESLLIGKLEKKITTAFFDLGQQKDRIEEWRQGKLNEINKN